MKFYASLPRFWQVALPWSLIASVIGILLIALRSLFDDELSIAIIATGATIFASTFSLVWQRNREKMQTIEQQIREKKTPVYEKLITATVGTFLSEKKETVEQEKPQRGSQKRLQAQSEDSPDLARQLRELMPDLIIWGTDDVLASFVQIRRVSAKDDKTLTEIILSYESMLQKIRQDLGHEDRLLQQGDLLRMFINDIDQHLHQ